MNWNAKYTSIEEIIGKVYRDMGLADQINYADAIEWAGEAIELIGAPFHLSHKTERLQITNHRAKLPCDLHAIEGTLGYKIDITGDEDPCDVDTSSYTAMRYSTDTFHHWYCKGEHFNDHLCHSNLTYKINDDFIFTSFDQGYVLMAYKAIPVDDNGFPKIPDDPKFKAAVAGHIMWKIGFIKWMQGKMPQAVYQKLEQDRDWYIGAAQTRANMPSVDMAESIKNNWIRLIPKINQHMTGFKHAGESEKRYTHNSSSSTSTGDLNSPTQDHYFYTDETDS